jgi:hypothetical protein
MDVQALFDISVLMCFLSFAIVTKLYLWPTLARWSHEDALVALMVPHTTRFIGLAFLVPGVAAPSLPRAFAVPAAYGDLIAAILAMLAIWAVRIRLPGALSLVWLFNLWGAADLLFAFYQGRIGTQMDPALLGAAFFIPTVPVPPLMVIHGLIFWLLLRRPRSATISAATSP